LANKSKKWISPSISGGTMPEQEQRSTMIELMVKGRVVKDKIRKKNRIPSSLKTTRKKCLDCVCGSASEVKLCHLSNCPSWPYRFGRSPKEEDLRVPVYDKYGNFVDYRPYKGYPAEVDGCDSEE